MNLQRAVLCLCMLLVVADLQAQVKDEMLLKRSDKGKEGINPDEIVSFKNDVPVAKALQSLSELAKKLVLKPIVFDPEVFKDKKIGVDIVQMPWRSAMETILRASGLWYQETQDYFQLVTPQGAILSGPGGTTTGGTTTTGFQPIMGLPSDSASALVKEREVTISAIFLEINTSKLREMGISFSIFRGRDLNLGIEFKGSERVSQDLFGITVDPTSPRLAVNVNTALKLFETSSLGEIIARPQITVRSGMKGRVQVGEDFSVKQRTISGDVTEVFYSTGTILDVTPKILNYQGIDFIDVSLSVERSALIDPATSRINRTKADSKLLLLNGEESYVGGLFLNDQTVLREGVPLLKDLPWWFLGLRYIFGYDRVQVSKKELIVLLKAELLPFLEQRVTQKAKNIMDEKLKEGRGDLKRRSEMDKD